ncbi:RNA ligase-domain-containing protein [Lyophyllum atratum]|nr:RNA ligase-domain-containing protein [Lyophyllum atratum]
MTVPAVRTLVSRKEDSQLIANLYTLSKKSPKLVKSHTYAAPADPSITVRSWKMSEFKYYDIPSPFPTLARGIFTVELPPNADQTAEGDLEQKYRIVARGYDKFFNIGEWSSLESHTASPYTLTLKSNGCIIFIAALNPSKLVITSKHSIGPVEGQAISHAQAGEGWLRKHLATRLWENNWTAVAELCDDSFEEHVLGYTPEKTGLHLHGINESTKHFRTLPQSSVDAFADEWGFIKTLSIVLKTIPEVRAFTSEVGEVGEWKGEAVEGFVVRTHVTEPPTGGKAASASPYAPGSSFFFKVTKKLLSAGAPNASALPKAKMRRPETKVYVRWVIDEIRRDRAPFKEYTKGKGIIATRERFLDVGDKNTVYQKTIIVPVAIPGCGKTAVAVALEHIFGFGHTQSDDVVVKKSAPQFIKNVTNLLKTHDVVIADKNNHLAQHRQALRDVAKSADAPTRVLALNWAVGSVPQATVHRVCGDRVTLRGANHQSLRPDANSGTKTESWKAAVRRAVDGCVKIIGLKAPSEEKIKEALGAVGAYKAGVKKPDEAKKTKDGARYYGLLAEVDLEEVLGTALGAGASFWGVLRGAGRVTRRPHVTVVHRNSLPGEGALWKGCAGLQALKQPPLFRGRLGHLVWNPHVMAVTVESLEVVEEEQGGADRKEGAKKGEEFLKGLSEETKQRLHITVATKSASIPGVEAKTLVEAWRKGEKTDAAGEIKAIELKDIVVTGRVKGLHG